MVRAVGEGSRLHGVTDLPVEHPDAADLSVVRDAHRAQRVVGRGGDLKGKARKEPNHKKYWIF